MVGTVREVVAAAPNQTDGFSDLTELAFCRGQTGTNSEVHSPSGGGKCSGESKAG